MAYQDWIKQQKEASESWTLRVRVTLEYEGTTYVVEDGPYEDEGHAEYQWTDGNYGCDDNKSLFIINQCDPDFDYMDCGDDIKLVKLEYFS